MLYRAGMPDRVADRHLWEQPGAHEEAPGVYRIPLPLPGDGLRAVNVYAITEGEHVVLVDSGWALAESQELLAKSLDSIGYGLGDIRDFLITHIHRDHYTQAVAVRRVFGGRISLGIGEQANLAAIHRQERPPPDVARLRAAGAEELARAVAEWKGVRELDDADGPDSWLEDGVDIELGSRTLRVIATPGHTRGHVVYHDVTTQALFAGDHVLPHITPSIGTELARPASPLRDYLSSLELVRALPDMRLLPAHGPVTDSVHTRIDELIAHHERRLTDTAKAVESGATAAFEVAHILTWTRRERTLDELDVFNQLLATQETVAHLEVLVERGWLTKTSGNESDPVDRYARA